MVGSGTDGYTVRDVMDRLYQTILTPPDDQYIQVQLAADIAQTDDVVKLGVFTVPEDSRLLRQGSLLEADQELMRVLSYDGLTNEAVVERGAYSTGRQAHATPMLVTVNPIFTRAGVFEAVADNLITLYPKLYTTSNELLTAVTGGVFPIGDDLAVEVLDINPGDFVTQQDIQGNIVDFHPMTGGRALVLNLAYGGGNSGGRGSLATGQVVSQSAAMGTVWLRYRRRMAKATSESDLLSDLGVDDRWVRIVMFGVAADLLAGRDVTATQTEWVKSVLEAENIRVGSRMSIAGGLKQLRNMLLEDARAEMSAEYRPRVTMMPTFNQVT